MKKATKKGLVRTQVLMVMTVYLVLSLLLSGCASFPETDGEADTALLIIDKNGTLTGVTDKRKLKGKLIVPEGVKIIGEEAFSGCTRLNEVWFPASLTYIESSAFERCKRLTKVDFSLCNKLTYIGERAFNKCKNLHGVLDLSTCTNLTVIDHNAFRECCLSKVRFPANLTQIGGGAFEYNLLDEVDISLCNKLTYIYYRAFDDSSPISFKLPLWNTRVIKLLRQSGLNLR